MTTPSLHGDDGQRSYTCVTCGPFSGVVSSLLPLVANHFPDLEQHRFDVASWIREERRTLLSSLLGVLAENGLSALLGRSRLRRELYRSRRLGELVSAEMSRRVAAQPHAFTFQMQSLFDASVAGVPHFVYTDHTAMANSYYPDFDPGSISPAQFEREREIYRNASVVFTMGSHVARSLQDHYGIDPSRIAVVGAGANVDPPPAPEEEAPPPDEQILFAGRDWTRKGGPQLVAAMPLVRERHPAATLVVAGCSPRIDLAGVRVLGDLSLQELADLYRSSQIFCMPTRAEPFGLVYLEAFQSGLPVVATEIGALPDIVQDGETGLLVPPDDVEALAGALIELLDDPDRARRFGALGRERTGQRFTWPRVAAAISSRIGDVVEAEAVNDE
jgi:glycosyltransferase involved in cell wall biosynthesis